jgi:sulfonate transport system substrate-binding protein
VRRTVGRHRLGRQAAALFLAGFLTACGGAAPAGGGGGGGAGGGGAPQGQTVPVNVGIANNLFGTALFVGVEKGIFARHGLNVRLKIFSTGQEVSKALTAGDVDFGTSAMNNFQAELAGGVVHTAVASLMGNAASLINDSSMAIVAAPGSGIREGHPEDLRGKKVGLSLGGTAELYLRAVLAKAGVPASSVQFVNVPPGNSVTVLQNRSVDAVSAWEPYNSLMLAKVPGSVLVSRDGGLFGYVIFVLTEAREIQQHPDVVQKYVDAYAEACQYVRQHPSEAAQVDTHWIQGLDAQTAEAGLKNVPFDPRVSPYTLQAWDLSNRLLVQLQMLKAPQGYQGHFDTSFLLNTQKQHPEYFSDLGPAETVSLK